LFALGSVALLVHCKTPPDPERDERERYAAALVATEDGGPHRLSLVTRTELTFGEGFYPNEYDYVKHETWRWAQKHAEMDVACPADPARRTLVLRGYCVVKNGKLQTTRVTVDGAHVATIVGGKFVQPLALDAQCQAAQSRKLHITFDSDLVLYPAEDLRDLAVNFEGIDWEPR